MVLKDLQAYLDDIIVYSSCRAEHETRLKAVLYRLQEAGLSLNTDKCKFYQDKLTYLGHSISKEGLLPNDDHIAAIRDAPSPSDPATLRSFLGLTLWYSKFIQNYATVVEPMRDVLRRATFTWTDEAQSSFQQVKLLITDSSSLALFDPSLPTIVSTDASDYGIGGVLTQIHPDNTERTVAFASRSLSAAESKYSVVEKEALACVWAAERWRTYLWGTKFTLRTDHQALTTLLATKGMGRVGMRVARWSARLLCFNYDIVYRPGAREPCSRLPFLPATATQTGLHLRHGTRDCCCCLCPADCCSLV